MPVKRTRLAARRKTVGFSQDQLAELLKVDRSAIVRWESGETTPQPWVRVRIAKALQVSVDQLDEFLTVDYPAATEADVATGIDEHCHAPVNPLINQRTWTLAANIISTFSYQLANTGKPRQAAILARTAYAGARYVASATTKALLLERVAWADAKSGDLKSCEWNLGLVNESFSESNPGNDPDWVYWLSKEEIDVMAGRCFTELGQPAKAIPLLTNSIEKYDNTHIREISLYQSWLAKDYIRLRDIRTATDLAIQVMELGGMANSVRTDGRLHHLATLLQEHKNVQNVAQFLDQYEAYFA